MRESAWERRDETVPRYVVDVREVWVVRVTVDADTPEQAMDLVEKGGGEWGESEYSHTLDRSRWTVREGNKGRE